MTFDKPSFAQARLIIDCFSRSDLVLNSGKISFNTVPKGAARTGSAKIDYAGDLDWNVASAKCENTHLDVRLEETHREQTDKGYAIVGYELFVTLLPDAPVGRIDDTVVLEINDRHSKTIEVLVQGTVEDTSAP